MADGYKVRCKLTRLDLMVLPRLREASLLGATCAVTSTTSGHRDQIRDRPARRSTGSANLLYVERDIMAEPAECRYAARQKFSLSEVLRRSLLVRGNSSGAFRGGGPDKRSNLAKAFRYGLNRSEAFSLFLEDGRVANDQ